MKSPPPFGRVGIVSLGALGCTLGVAIRRAWPSVLVIGLDGHDALERAVRLHAIDVGADGPWILKDAELVVLTGSRDQSVEVLTVLGDHLPDAVVITSAGDHVPALIDAARALPPRMTFLPGWLAVNDDRQASATLPELDGREWWLWLPSEESNRSGAVERLDAFVTGLGARLRVMSGTPERDAGSTR